MSCTLTMPIYFCGDGGGNGGAGRGGEDTGGEVGVARKGDGEGETLGGASWPWTHRPRAKTSAVKSKVRILETDPSTNFVLVLSRPRCTEYCTAIWDGASAVPKPSQVKFQQRILRPTSAKCGLSNRFPTLYLPFFHAAAARLSTACAWVESLMYHGPGQASSM